jgi:hypothetical protein
MFCSRQVARSGGVQREDHGDVDCGRGLGGVGRICASRGAHLRARLQRRPHGANLFTFCHFWSLLVMGDSVRAQQRPVACRLSSMRPNEISSLNKIVYNIMTTLLSVLLGEFEHHVGLTFVCVNNASHFLSLLVSFGHGLSEGPAKTMSSTGPNGISSLGKIVNNIMTTLLSVLLGKFEHHAGLTFVCVYNAGHMVRLRYFNYFCHNA